MVGTKYRWHAASAALIAAAALAPAAAAQGTPPVPASSAGEIYVWGDNWGGELGTGGNTGLAYAGPIEVPLPGGEKAIEVDAGAGHGLAVTSDGKLYAWGDNGEGDLGQGGTDTTESDTPIQVDLPPGTEIASATAGGGVSYAVTTSGEVYAWGDNQSGQLGDGSQDDPNGVPVTHATPTLIAGLSGVKQVAATGYGNVAAAFAVTDSGEVYAWGSANGGQLGNGDLDSDNADFVLTPKAVSGLPSISEVSASGDIVMALATDGDMYGWGVDTCDQLDNGVGSSPTAVCKNGTVETTPQSSIMPSGVTFNWLGFGTDGLASSPNGDIYMWDHGNAYTDGDYFTPTQYAVPGDAPVEYGFATDWCNYALTRGGQLYANGASDDSCGFGTNGTEGSSTISPLLPVTFPVSGASVGVVQVSEGDSGGGGDGWGAAIVGALPAAPKVTAVSPPSGPLVGGNTVAISGTGFASGATVQFGSLPAANVKVISPTEVTATAPAHAAGTVDVIVSGSSPTSADHYTYVNPSITALSPTSGPTKGGKTVTITGNGFATGATVTFGAHAATGVTVNSPTSLTAIAPAGTGTVAVTAKVGAVSSNTAKFTYVPPPTVSGLSEKKGTFSFKLSQAATVKVSLGLERKHKKPKPAGSQTAHEKAGHDKLVWKHKLAAGSYVATVTATNSLGEKATKTLKFTVKK